MSVEIEARQSAGPSFRLGDWRVEPELGRISNGKTTTPLRPKVMDLLVTLARRPGELFSKQELLDAVWPTVVVADGSLSVTVAELREALGDDSTDPRYIETIARRGYRLIAPVEAIASEEATTGSLARFPAPEGPAGEVQDTFSPTLTAFGEEKGRRSRLRPVAWVVGLGLLVLVIGYWQITRQRLPISAPVEEPHPHRIAVVPFENLTGDPSFDTVGRRATETVLQALTELEDITVVPAAEVAKAISDADAVDAFEIGSATRAGLVLTGVFAPSDQGLELRATLEDTVDHKILRAFDPIPASPETTGQAIRTLRDWTLIEVQDSLYPVLAFGRGDRIPKIEAYREYRMYLETTDADFGRAWEHLYRALEIDPELDRARLWLAVVGTSPGIADIVRKPALESYEALLQRSDSLNSSQLRTLAAIRERLDGNWEQALRILRELQAERDHSLIRALIVGTAVNANRPHEAIESYAGITWDPITPSRVSHAVGSWFVTAALHRLGRHEEELELARSFRAAEPVGAVSQWPEYEEMVALAALGKVAELQKLWTSDLFFKRMRASGAPNTELITWLAAELRVHGYPEAALDLAERGLQWNESPAKSEPEQFLARLASGGLMVHAGRLGEAHRIFRELHRDFPNNHQIWAELGSTAAATGDRATVQEMTTKLSESNGGSYGMDEYGRARIAARLGHRDAALNLLRSAVSLGFWDWEHLHQCPDFDRMREDPEFQEIVQPKG